MQHRNIKYNYSEWTTYNGKKASGYSCEAFNHHPYHVQTFSTELEQDMITQIDEYIDNRDKYEARREQTNKAAKEFYNSMGHKVVDNWELCGKNNCNETKLQNSPLCSYHWDIANS